MKYYSGVVSEVIGNDPVLDQFDIAYKESFYGTHQDSFITGSFLSFNTTKTRSKYSPFVTGSRARATSKIDADSTPTVGWSAQELKTYPLESTRVVPWRELVDNSFRNMQCIDETERFYDTCLPSVEKCFKADNTEVWTTVDDPLQWLSPYNSVETNKTGYLIFNAKKSSENSAVINNHWTWSYPYEAKYHPNQRYLNSKDILNISTDFATWWSGPPTTNNDTVTNSPLDIIPSAWLTSQEPFTYVARKKRKQKVESFIALPAGKNDYSSYVGTGPNPNVSTGKNGLRSSFTLPVDSQYDSLGYSYIIPSDIFLNRTTSVRWGAGGITPYVTGTCSNENMLKFLFGFGDVNNITYSDYELQSQQELNIFSEYFHYRQATAASQIPEVRGTVYTETVRVNPDGYFGMDGTQYYQNDYEQVATITAEPGKSYKIYGYYENAGVCQPVAITLPTAVGVSAEDIISIHLAPGRIAQTIASVTQTFFTATVTPQTGQKIDDNTGTVTLKGIYNSTTNLNTYQDLYDLIVLRSDGKNWRTVFNTQRKYRLDDIVSTENGSFKPQVTDTPVYPWLLGTEDSWTSTSTTGSFRWIHSPTTGSYGWKVLARDGHTDVLSSLGGSVVSQISHLSASYDVAEDKTYGIFWSDNKYPVPVTSSADPVKRASHCMCFDSNRNVAVMFGGMFMRVGFDEAPDIVELNDTWEWNGTNWSQKTVTDAAGSPPKFADANERYNNYSMEFHAGTNKSVLFTSTGETWTWNGTAWTQESPATNPTGRHGACMAYDPDRDVIVMFGGHNGVSTYYDETWEWNGTNWTQYASGAVTKPDPRRWAAMSYSHSNGGSSYVVLFGGSDATDIYDDVWLWNGSSWSQVTFAGGDPLPFKRHKHVMCQNENQKVLLYSGASEFESEDTMMYGGNTRFLYPQDVWEWDGATSTWENLRSADCPPARLHSAMCYDSARQKVVLFGGLIKYGSA